MPLNLPYYGLFHSFISILSSYFISLLSFFMTPFNLSFPLFITPSCPTSLFITPPFPTSLLYHPSLSHFPFYHPSSPTPFRSPLTFPCPFSPIYCVIIFALFLPFSSHPPHFQSNYFKNRCTINRGQLRSLFFITFF